MDRNGNVSKSITNSLTLQTIPQEFSVMAIMQCGLLTNKVINGILVGSKIQVLVMIVPVLHREPRNVDCVELHQNK